MKKFLLAIIIFSFGCNTRKHYVEAQNGKPITGTVIETFKTSYKDMSLNWIMLKDSTKVVIHNGKYDVGSAYNGKIKKLIL
ncbi:hypothetical protein [Pedobacter namyangjuensis]|uniref:hypothetical protein n=1 Tax=Pedobacter namyangjuensis TaxID=600626 RepID=UPI000DE2EA19|nr:hypothetical protein [Pedobacter namyangjuensis]